MVSLFYGCMVILLYAFLIRLNSEPCNPSALQSFNHLTIKQFSHKTLQLKKIFSKKYKKNKGILNLQLIGIE